MVKKRCLAWTWRSGWADRETECRTVSSTALDSIRTCCLTSRPSLEAVDSPPPEQVAADPDIALASSGCWVTRIRLKQRNRQAEHALLTAEGFGDVGVAAGREYPGNVLTDTWRSLIFTQFHDAITATHIDEANRDLMGISYGWIDADAAALTARRRLHDHRTPGEHRR